MDQSQPPSPFFGGRYELKTQDENGHIEVVDREPWQRCWACGSTGNVAGESYCTNCGAALEQRTYSGRLLSAAEAKGINLLASVADEDARAVLPVIWDQVESDGQVLMLQVPGDASPVRPPVAELAALRIGYSLACLLAALHAEGVALERLAPPMLGLTTDGRPRLLEVPRLYRMETGDDQAAATREALHGLAGLLETLTITPRTTRRLPSSERSGEPGSDLESGLPTADDPAALLTAELASLPDEQPADDFAVLLRQVRTDVVTSASELASQLADLIDERTRPLPLHQSVGALSDTGFVRDHNEDSLLTINLCLNNTSQSYTRGLYVVADGMGGHAAGEIASRLAVRGVADAILQECLDMLLDPDLDYDETWVRDALRRAVLQANEAVRRAGIASGNDMGTTMTAALVIGDRAIVANVGDSRTYLARDGALRRISRDHSLVMRLVELGQLNDDDIYTHPQRNAVLRSLGDQAHLEVDLFTERLQPGDVLLLCSDGQWEMTRDAEMAQIIAAHLGDEQRACVALIEAANRAGGEDNITSVLVRFTAPDK